MSQPATILVVDDIEQNRLLIRQLFEGDEYRVLEAADGVSGLETAQRARPDCILLDLHMPGLNGFETVERLARDPRTREIPVIILTASDESLAAMARAFQHGAVDYITKPISPMRVVIRVQGAIERKRLLADVHELRASFTSMLVHDLRAPLTVIKAYGELFQATANGLSDKHRKYLQGIQDASDRMIRLIGEILDLSKLEAGKLSLDPKPIDLAELARDVTERLQPLAVTRGIDLTCQAPGPLDVLADPRRLDQVLMNLLGNALKFTPAGGRIEVGGAAVPDGVEVSVTDSGPGIATDEMPLLFEKFGQTSTGKATPGTGLGLVVCRHLVEAHRGRIWAESEPGTGTRFLFRIPAL